MNIKLAHKDAHNVILFNMPSTTKTTTTTELNNEERNWKFTH
jgi:hypothetical protein